MEHKQILLGTWERRESIQIFESLSLYEAVVESSLNDNSREELS